MDRMRQFFKDRWAVLLGALAIVLAFHLNPALALLGGGGLIIGFVNINDDVIKYLIKQNFLDSAGGYKLNIRAKTADYTIVTGTDPSGTIFTNRGAAGTVNFTLPAPAAALAGVFYEFLGIADQAILVATATADTLVALNDTAADSVAQSTATKLIGSHMRFVCDGTAWAGYGDAVGGTFTVAT
jgi:hypothetical protein